LRARRPDEAAAADRHHDRVHVRALLEELEPERALARDDAIVVERVHEGEPTLGRDLAAWPYASS